MHKLDRSGVVPPACLEAYDYKTQCWADLAGPCKRDLRAALATMQGIPGTTTPDFKEYGLRCVYCEGSIHCKGHIEHFRRKGANHFPQLTFAWSNLFLACGSNEHCGHFKDRSGASSYDPVELVKPDEDEPDRYFYFHSSGEVRARSGLNSVDTARAVETIRVLGLDNRSLEGARAQSLLIYKARIAADLDELVSWPIADRQAYLTEEIEATRYQPYATTIKHFLQRVT